MTEESNGLLLAFDQATVTGWAVVNLKGKYVTSGVIDTRGSIANRGESAAARYMRFRAEFCSLVDKYNPVYVIHEQTIPPMGGKKTSWATADFAVGLKVIMQVECHSRDVPILNVMPGTLKKFATGNGRAQKTEMVDACNKWLSEKENYADNCECKKKPISVKDDNEADAIHIARFIAETYTKKYNQ